MVSEPYGQGFLVERVVTGGDGEGVGCFNGFHGDGAEFSFGCSVAEDQVGDEFG